MSSPLASSDNRPLDQLKVTELKEELRKRGLSLKGVKKELFERLEEAIRKEGQAGVVQVEPAADEAQQEAGFEIADCEEDAEGIEKTDDTQSSHDADVVHDHQVSAVAEGDQDANSLPKDMPSQAMEVDPPPEDLEPKKGLDNIVTGNDDGIVSNVEACENSSLTDPSGLNNETCAQEHVDGQDGTGVVLDSSKSPEQDLVGSEGNPDLLLAKATESDFPQGQKTSEGEGYEGNLNSAGDDLHSPVGETGLVAAAETHENVGPENVSQVEGLVHSLEGPVLTDEATPADTKTELAERSAAADLEMSEAHDAVNTSNELNVLSPHEKQPDVQDGAERGERNRHVFLDDSEGIRDKPHDNQLGIKEEPQGIKEEPQGIKEEPQGIKEEPHDLEHLENAKSLLVENVKLEVQRESRDDSVMMQPQLDTQGIPANKVKVESVQGEEPRTGEQVKHSRDIPRTQKIREDESRWDSKGHFKELESKNTKESEYDRSRRDFSRSQKQIEEQVRLEVRHGSFKESRDSMELDEKANDTKKRKDEDRDIRLQEPAKRQRRWNSGKDLMGEASKPLTAGTVKEITYSEVKEAPLASTPKPTQKILATSRAMPPAVKVDSAANGDNAKPRVVPPPKRSPTTSLKIERFIRPFTLKAVKDLLAEYGCAVDFWMDQIKTHCYVTYSSVDQAVAARNGLYDRQWPPSFGNLLVAEFVDSHEVKMRSEGHLEKPQVTPVTTPRAMHNANTAATAPAVPLHGQMVSLPPPPPLRERQALPPVKKEPEPSIPTLDDLFKKTRAKPHIYYLPLSDEQVAAKLAVEQELKAEQAVRP